MTLAARLVAGALLAGAVAGTAAGAALPVLDASSAGAASPTTHPSRPTTTTTAPAATTESAATLYRQAMATTHGWSVHYTSSSTQSSTSGKVTLLETGDSGPASGTQSVTFRRGTLTGSISIAVIGGITYVKGDANGLANLAGLGPLQATASAGRWIDFATTNAAFSQVVAGVRSHDVAQELALTGILTLGRPRLVGGIPVLAIEGTQGQGSSGSSSGSGTHATRPRAVLYVRAHGRHVPVEEETVDAKGRPDGALQVHYSNWGEHVRPQAPLAAVTLGPVTTT